MSLPEGGGAVVRGRASVIIKKVGFAEIAGRGFFCHGNLMPATL